MNALRPFARSSKLPRISFDCSDAVSCGQFLSIGNCVANLHPATRDQFAHKTIANFCRPQYASVNSRLLKSSHRDATF